MYKILKSLVIIISLIIAQIFIYNIFLKSIITTWGASKQEVSLSMTGDAKNLKIISTRAILINSEKANVWKCLVQLGADRNGFYSYTFLEEILGYKTRQPDTNKPEFTDIHVGDIIRGSIDEKNSIVPYNFKVLYVKPEETFVLEQWGTFLLKKISPHQTRLIIRTQEVEAKNLTSKIAHYVMIPLHYIMERRTLLGLKDCAESPGISKLSQNEDILWFIGLILSGVMIVFFIFTATGFLQSIVMPLILSTFWMLSLLIFPPSPIFSISLLFFTYLAIFIAIKKR